MNCYPMRLTRFLAFLIFALTALRSTAQTVNVTAMDPGPYGPGSTIAVKVQTDNAAVLQKDNVYNLYLSDANGDFTNEKLIGSYNGFGTNGAFAGFVNGVIPDNTPNGTGYKVRVKTTKPASVGPASGSFYILPVTGAKASASSAVIDPAFPEVYGTCSGRDGNTFTFNSTSAAGAVVTATFYNDLDGSVEGPFLLTPFYPFKAKMANYTVIIRSLESGKPVGTKAYLLLNNVINTNFGTTSAGPVCLTDQGANVFYSVDMVSLETGIQRNFPGTLYTINWGDGSSNVYTFANIKAMNGQFTHTYQQSSCGRTFNGSITNAYQISFVASNPFCSSTVPINVFQAVLTPPKNSLSGPASACTGSVVNFSNTSYPGQSPSTKTSNCQDPNATYSWFVDGVQQAAGKKLTDPFAWKFTSKGQHTVSIRLENSASGCIPSDATINICVQDPPQPKFALSTTNLCTPGTVATTDNTVLDNGCNTNYTYLWTVTPSTGVTYATGNKNSKEPVFKFATAGKYTIQLQVSGENSSCTVTPYTQTVIVNSTPQATLSPDFAICGKGQTYKFTTATGKTQTTFAGTSETLADTYTWTVTAPDGAGAAEFTDGTNSHSQYPSIKFPDFGTYTITVTNQNACGTTATATQKITFQNAPTASAGQDVTVCPGTPVTLQGTVSDMTSVNGAPTWGGGTASAFSDIHSFTPTYTPTAADAAKGSVVLTLTVPTSLTGDCHLVTSSVTIKVNPVNTVTSAAEKSICSGTGLTYHITSSVANSTYTWTASAPTTVMGYSPSGTGDIQEGVIYNTSLTDAGVVTYTIVPHANGCDGTPFTLKVNIQPPAVISATSPGNICSGQATGIKMTSNIAVTSYTWKATATDANVVGYSNNATATTNASIPDVLINNGTAPATVTYVISSYSGATADGCAGNIVTTAVTVQPKTATANAGPDESLCGVTTYKLKGNTLGNSTQGLWTVQSGQSGVTFDDASKPDATASGLQLGQVYVFRWSATGGSSCGNNYDDVTIKNVNDNLVADIKADKLHGCGPLTVKFTNNSTEADGLTYTWDFGNGVTSNLKNPDAVTFIGQGNGKDSVYTVKLTIANGCKVASSSVLVTVKPVKPIAQIAPDKTTGCVPFTVNLENISPGTNDRYTYYLLNANGTIIGQQVRIDKEPQPFTINTPGTYQVYMVAQNECGMTQSSTTKLVVSPGNITSRLTVDGDQLVGCGPFTVTFHNNTTGASSFRYDWGDGTPSLTTTSTGDVTHTFVKGGYYRVVLHSANSCTIDMASAPVTINVLYQPEVAVSADVTTGCRNLTVHFSNNTNDAGSSEVSDLKYDWDFGDGSEHSHAVNPVHKFTTNGSPFTVTLTATNATGCSKTIVMKDMIAVHMPSLTDFTANPDSVIEIPNYRFSFIDKTSNNPIAWHWDFGDGTTSTSRNPEHTYADTGRYKVTLITSNQYCDSAKTHWVQVKGVPGQLFVPNAFMPSSITPTVKTFAAKGSGIKEWRMQIFNNYGQMVFQTTKLSAKGEPLEEWDGTFNGVQMPQGTYLWEIQATFINGNQWRGMSYNGAAPKRTGIIYLLR